MSMDLPLIELYLPSSSVLMLYDGGDGYDYDIGSDEW